MILQSLVIIFHFEISNMNKQSEKSYLSFDVLPPLDKSSSLLDGSRIDICPIWEPWIMEFLQQVDNQSFQFKPSMSGKVLSLKNYTTNQLVTFFCIIDYPIHNITKIVASLLVFLIAVTGNFMVLINLWKNRRRWNRSRIQFFIMHLAIADLIVMITPLVEVILGLTISWYGGRIFCKIYKFSSTFGLYLSSYSVVCIAIDRYFSISKPTGISNSKRRSYSMLIISWIISTLFSIPQLFVFKEIRHGFYNQWYVQCMEGFEISRTQRKIYNFTAFVLMYGLPLVIIISAYTAILLILNFKTNNHAAQQNLNEPSFDEQHPQLSSNLIQQRSAIDKIARARIKTLKLTLIIVFVFIICWAPYWMMAIFWSIQEEAASQMNSHVADIFMIFALSNSCVNPLVYGLFQVKPQRRTAQRIRFHIIANNA